MTTDSRNVEGRARVVASSLPSEENDPVVRHDCTRARLYSLEQMQRRIMDEITSKYRAIEALNNQVLGIEMVMNAMEVHHR